MFDVIIVGAGPAGSTAAKNLAEKGYKVLIVDKEKFPRNKPCGGGIPLRVLERFSYIIKEELFESYSYAGKVFSSDLNEFSVIKKKKPLVALVLREKFDNGLLNLAKNSGAVVKDKSKVKDIKILNRKTKIFLENGNSFESKIIIGADGIWSIVARKAGLSQRNKDIGFCVFNESPMNNSSIEKYFGKNRLCHIHLRVRGVAGYGWIFPKKNHVNIGLSEYRPLNQQNVINKDLKQVFLKYIDDLKEKDFLPKNLEIRKILGGFLPVCPLKKTYSNRIVLCGDAAGLINPISGEGIYYAMASGEIAAKAIDAVLKSDKINENSLKIYQKMWKRDFGKDLLLLSKFTKNWMTDTNRFVKYTKLDDKLADIAIKIFQGDLYIHKSWWRIIYRIFYVYFREFVKKNI